MKKLTKCEICGKERYIKPGRIGRYSACMGKCYSELRRIHWEDFYKERVGKHLLGSRKGMTHTEKTKQTIREKLLGKSRPLSENHRKNLIDRMTGNQFYKLVKNRPSGEKHHNWRGGRRNWKKIIYDSVEYKKWRKSVFERDNYTCQFCKRRNGNGETIYLEADHIKPFALYEELRLELSNGRTLCRECHIKTPTFSRRIKSREHYEQLISK